MTRTYRHRRSVPRGLKVRDGDPCFCYDTDGKRYFTNGDFTGKEVRWHQWFSDVGWIRGLGYANLAYHMWLYAFFDGRKISHAIWQVKRFSSELGSGWRRISQYRRLSRKAYRRDSAMKICAEQWEKLPAKANNCGRHRAW